LRKPYLDRWGTKRAVRNGKKGSDKKGEERQNVLRDDKYLWLFTKLAMLEIGNEKG